MNAASRRTLAPVRWALRWLHRHIPHIFAAVLALNGLFNLASGLAPILSAGAPDAVDQVREYVQLTPGHGVDSLVAVLLGLLLIVLGRGLYHRRRNALVVSLLVLLAVVATNLFNAAPLRASMPSAALVVGLLIFAREFNRRPAGTFSYGQLVATVSVLFTMAYGVVGSYLLRESFAGIDSWSDAIYFTFVTYSTLGYGDVLPIDDSGKTFVVSMIIIGLTTFIAAFSVAVGPLLESRLKGVMTMVQRLQRMRDHVVICGYGGVAESVIAELRERDRSYVIVEQNEEMVARLRDAGHEVMLGDPTLMATLRDANVDEASALVAAYDSDAINTLVAVSASELRTSERASFRIVVRVEEEENIDKVRHLGADEVISPSTIAGRLMARRALGLTPTEDEPADASSSG